MTLKLKEKLYEKLISEVQRASPHEVCGILSGKITDGEEVVEEVYPRENKSDSPTHKHFIPPEDALKVFEEIEEKGQDILGFYHSHSDSLQPSNQDIDEAYWENYIYLIISVESEDVKAWRWSGQGFEKEELKIS